MVKTYWLGYEKKYWYKIFKLCYQGRMIEAKDAECEIKYIVK
jgi:hypothetical protein